MSEWKWCLDCGHHYDEHTDGRGLCLHTDGEVRCDCQAFYQEIANFL